MYIFLWQDGWQELPHEGFINELVIKSVWKDFEAEEQQQLLDIMKQFDLICDAPNDEVKMQKANTDKNESGASSFQEKNYFVPSMFQPGCVKQLGDMASLVFYVDFQGLFTGMTCDVWIILILIIIVLNNATNSRCSVNMTWRNAQWNIYNW